MVCITFLLFFNTAFSQNIQKRNITADVNQITGTKSTIFNECIGAGRTTEGLRAHWQQQLACVQKDISLKYIRFHVYCMMICG
jgi:xylan 1,4-beta-xylosidase